MPRNRITGAICAALLGWGAAFSCRYTAADEPVAEYRFGAQTQTVYLGAPPSPITLSGFDLAPRPEADADRPHFVAGRPFRLALRSRVEDPTAAEVTVRVEITGSGPALRFTLPVDIGSAGVGAAAESILEDRLPWIGYSGNGILRFFLTWRGAGGDAVEPVLAGTYPCYVVPMASRSLLDAADVRRHFDAGWRRTERGFRLGNGAALRLPLEPGTPAIDALGVVSAFAYDDSQAIGDVIAEIVFYRPGRSVLATHPLVYGYDTFRVDADVYDPGSTGRSSVSIFSSEPSDRTGPDGQPLKKHAYWTVIELDEAAEVAEIEFRLVTAGAGESVTHGGVLDVKEVLIRAEAAP